MSGACDTGVDHLWMFFRARFIPLLEFANEDCLKIVVGMKLDALGEDQREVTVQEGKKFAREINDKIDLSKLPSDPYFETSSKTGHNVTEVFEYIFRYCLPLSEAQLQATNRQGTVNLPNGKQSQKKCCSHWYTQSGRQLLSWYRRVWVVPTPIITDPTSYRLRGNSKRVARHKRCYIVIFISKY